MALNFPSSPTNGQIYTIGSRSWKYNGSGWEVVSNISGYTGSQGYTGSAGMGYVGSQGYTGSHGDLGYTGSQGPAGSFGGAAFDYTFDTDTTDSNPGTGLIRFDNTDLSAATMLYINTTDDNNVSTYNYLQTIDDSTSAIKGHFTVSQKANTANFAMFAITGSHYHHQTEYIEVPVSYISGITSFADNTDIIITFARTGDIGDTGYVGSRGDIGYTGSQGSSGYVTSSNVSIISNAITIDLSNIDVSVFNCSLTDNISTINITNTPVTAGAVTMFFLVTTGDGVQRTITWPAAVKWQNSVPPTPSNISGKKDTYSFLTTDGGTTWLATVIGQNY